MTSSLPSPLKKCDCTKCKSTRESAYQELLDASRAMLVNRYRVDHSSAFPNSAVERLIEAVQCLSEE